MKKKPNILFILADDQRFDTIHALGNEEIHTPYLDWLAETGTAFTHAHIPGGTSGAVCMPSRAMLNSGKTLFHLYGAGEEIPACDRTMGEQFQKTDTKRLELENGIMERLPMHAVSPVEMKSFLAECGIIGTFP